MADSSPANALPPNYRLGEYVIESVLGHGGFGITYLARDTKLSSQVAIKEYFPEAFAIRHAHSTIHPRTEGGTSGAENYRWGLQEFLKEARALAQFKHNHIVRVLRFLEENGTAYMVMEYEEGESLADYLRRHGGFLDESTLLQVVLPVLSGLQAVHQAGMLHLDIKPDNIYLRANGQPMLIDFGSARQAKRESDQKRKVAITPAYSAIENYPNMGEQGPWTDVYSMGATIYRCITGTQPKGSMERHQVVAQGYPDPLPAATSFDRPYYSSYIRECVDWAMALSAEDRAHSAYALQQGLMGKGMSNAEPADQPKVNYRAGFIGVAKIKQDDDAPKEKRSAWERSAVALLFLAIVAVFLLTSGLVTFDDINTQIARGRALSSSLIAQARQGVEAALAPPSEPVAPSPPVPAVAPPPPAVFSTDRVLYKTLTGHNDVVRSVVFADQGRRLISAGNDGVVRLWNVETGELEKTLQKRQTDAAVAAISADGRLLAMSNGRHAITLVDASTLKPVGELAGHEGGVRQLIFSSDNRTLVSSSIDGSVIVWDTAEQRRIARLDGFGEAGAPVIAVAPNGRWLAISGSDGVVHYWSITDRKPLASFTAHEHGITALAFSPDGKWLVSAGPEHFLKLWGTGVDELERDLAGAPDVIYALAFSPDNRWLLAAGSNNAVHTWNVDDGQQGPVLEGHDPYTYSLALSPQGRLLASAGQDRTIRLWAPKTPADSPAPDAATSQTLSQQGE